MSHLVLHARPAVLTGLSPVKNRQVPQLNYAVVTRLARDFPTLQVTLNGGISGLSQFHRLAEELSEETAMSSLMAGRWILRRPLDLALVSHRTGTHASKGGATCPSATNAVKKYTSFVRHCMEQSNKSKQAHVPALQELVLPIFMVSEQLREDYERSDYDDTQDRLDVTELESIYDTITEAVQWMEGFQGSKRTEFSPATLQFNRLSSSFKSLVGNKVVNKWKRNRSEL